MKVEKDTQLVVYSTQVVLHLKLSLSAGGDVGGGSQPAVMDDERGLLHVLCE